jgi:hypothetical protein
MHPRRAVLVVAVLWLALALPHVAARYSYTWDSSQLERGVASFDIARHQPHPPGYPLWIFVLKGLTPLLGHPNSAQIVLALLFTIAGLLAFRALAREMLSNPAAADAATAVLAFSPVVCVNAVTPATYAVDLFVSCAVGWLAARLWSGQTRWAPLACATLAVAAGFRQSGATLLLPFLAVALWRSWRKHPRYAVAGLAAGIACGLAWYVPTALLSGGFARLAALNRLQALNSFSQTSAFFGAPWAVHGRMAAHVSIIFVFAFAGLAAPLAAALLRRGGSAGRPPLPAWATPLFFALWLAPNFVMLYFLHFGNPGYVLLSLPPLALLGARLALPVLRRPKWMGAAVAAGLLACYFPYELFVRPDRPAAAYHLLRATPRMHWLLERSQRQVGALIDGLPGPPQEKLLFCLRQGPEAPNIRTVTCEYPEVRWADYERSSLRVFAPHDGDISADWPPSVHTIGWLCDGAGPPPAVRARFPHLRRLAGNQLFSFWTAAAR